MAGADGGACGDIWMWKSIVTKGIVHENETRSACHVWEEGAMCGRRVRCAGGGGEIICGEVSCAGGGIYSTRTRHAVARRALEASRANALALGPVAGSRGEERMRGWGCTHP
jgi:hypothetical protein